MKMLISKIKIIIIFCQKFQKKLEILLTICFDNQYTHIIDFSEFQKLIFIIYILNLYFRIIYFYNVNFPMNYMQNFNGLALPQYITKLTEILYLWYYYIIL